MMMNRLQDCYYLLLCVYIRSAITSKSFDMFGTSCVTEWYSIEKPYEMDNLPNASSTAIDLAIIRNVHHTTLPNDTLERFQIFKQYLSISSKVNISKCEPLNFEDDLFDPVKNNMKMLGITNNNISSLPQNYFCGFSKLEVLAITYNAIRDIEDFGFGNNCSTELFRGKIYCLELNHNKITKVQRNAFRYLKRLKYLFLAANEINEIEPGAFNGLNRIQFIDLQSNSLKTFPSSVFQNLTSLYQLDLQFNKLVALSQFPSLPNLEYLNVSSNKLSSLPKLTSLRKLNTLDLANNDILNLTQFGDHVPRSLKNVDLSSNRITAIEKQTFSKHLKIVELHLSHNQITYIKPGAFDSNHKLRIILINGNQLKTLDFLPGTLPFRLLDASYNNILNFSLSASNITFSMLNLSHNQIDTFRFNSEAINVFSNDIVIDMSFNKLSRRIFLPIPHLANEIWLNDNAIESVDMSFSVNNDIFTVSIIKRSLPLKTLYLHNNNMPTFCGRYLFTDTTIFITLRGNPLKCSCETEWIKTQENKFLVVTDLKDVTCTSHYPKGETTKYLMNTEHFLCGTNCNCPNHNFIIWRDSGLNNGCSNSCLKTCDCYYNLQSSFIFVDCSRKNLRAVPNQELLSNEIHLFLDGNNITYLDNSSFSRVNNVKILYLNSSLINEIHPEAFHKITSLTLLQLENNLLKAIPEKAFAKLSELRQLFLAHNRLLHLIYFSGMEHLETLELHNNQLTLYPVWELENVTRLQSITLQENPWSCKCEFIEQFQGWLSRASNAKRKEKLSCKDRSKNHHLINDRFLECADKTVLWVSVTTTVAIVIVILCVLVFVFRREVQVLIYSKYGMRFSHRNDADTDRDKEFDIFTSYSSKDEDFLVTNILPMLEDIDHPYSVCVHDRDFLAGGYISENILSAIDKSRRTLVLLTEDYVESDWCRFEFRAAHTKMLEDKSCRLLIVVKDKVPKNVTVELRAYLRTNTYLTWGERMFWKKLLFALPKHRIAPKKETVETEC